MRNTIIVQNQVNRTCIKTYIKVLNKLALQNDRFKSIVMIIFPKLLSEYPTSLYPSPLTWTALYMVLVTLIFPVTPVTVIFLDIKEEDFLSFFLRMGVPSLDHQFCVLYQRKTVHSGSHLICESLQVFEIYSADYIQINFSF